MIPANSPLGEEPIQIKALSLLAVPLSYRQRRIGVLEVANKRDGAAFTASDVELLQILAAQATLPSKMRGW